jgi:hypothetical protein
MEDSSIMQMRSSSLMAMKYSYAISHGSQLCQLLGVSSKSGNGT